MYKPNWPYYQLKPGYCGPATFNNVMLSLNLPKM